MERLGGVRLLAFPTQGESPLPTANGSQLDLSLGKKEI